MKKIFLNEVEKQKIIADKEKANEKGLKIDLSSDKYQNIFNKLSNK